MTINHNDTIAAISTPLAPAGLGVVRISGADAVAVADGVFRGSGGRRLSDIDGYQALYGHVFDADGDIDEVVALKFTAPHSYTGEDVVEFSCHGGTYILRRLLRAVCSDGVQLKKRARLAAAGEFTQRAFENGKLDLTAAESVMDLIGAQGEQAHRAALSQRGGALYEQLCSVKSDLLGCSAALSAWVDFPDDEIPDTDAATLRATLCAAANRLQALIDGYGRGKLLRNGIDTVIVGKPNVGKSTLMNLLAGESRSIVSDVAGTTRDIVEEQVAVGGITLRLSDTAGMRCTDDPVEQLGVGLAAKKLDSAALILAVFDLSRPLDDDDVRLINSLKTKAVVAILNKSDLNKQLDCSAISAAIEHCVTISAATGDGEKALESAIMEVTGLNLLDPTEAMLANERQQSCAAAARSAADDAIAAIDAGFTLDAVGVCIDDAIAAICELTGEKVSENIVEEIFSRFCVGK